MSSPTVLGEFPQETGIPQLVWLIHAAASGHVTMDEFIVRFRDTHEAIERAGRPRYGSPSQARLIWDVLWSLEYYSPNPSQEDNPEYWHGSDEVLQEVRRVARRLAESEG